MKHLMPTGWPQRMVLVALMQSVSCAFVFVGFPDHLKAQPAIALVFTKQALLSTERSTLWQMSLVMRKSSLVWRLHAATQSVDML